MAKRKPTYIDLFSGAGGLSLGFDEAGFRNLWSVDIEPSFCETYRRNFPGHTLAQADIALLSEADIRRLCGRNRVDVVAGGPPCQGFSIAGPIGRQFIDDPRNRLFTEFVWVVFILKPKVFVMENVARLYSHNSGKTREEIISAFEEQGYTVGCTVLDAAAYGVPQHRYRTIFIGTRTPAEILFPAPQTAAGKHITVKEALEPKSL